MKFFRKASAILKTIINSHQSGSGPPIFFRKRRTTMQFFTASIGVLQTLVVALGAGLGIWGGVNLLEGYGNDNPGANAHVW